MCGIAGIFNYSSRSQADPEQVSGMLDLMRYRGPDSKGVFHDGPLALGNVRLAIQGLDSSGDQPMFNRNKSLVVVYSGEIYNHWELRTDLEAKGHHFQSTTDTELLVHLYEEYGIRLANHLNGMFAFALYDRRNETLYLGRDRSAQKPFYIVRTKLGVMFASEWNVLLPYMDSINLNPNSVSTYLSLGYVPEPHNFLLEVDCVSPGTVKKIRHSEETDYCYLDTSLNGELSIDTLEEWLDCADKTFSHSINRHLVSDVPISLFLSGGVDSSLLAVYLAQSGKVDTAYSGAFKDDPDHDESNFVKSLSEYTGLKVEYVDLSRATMANEVETFVDTSSFPQGDTSSLATFCLTKDCARNYKVVLGGDGGDELFAGYPTYLYPKLRQNFRYLPLTLIKLGRLVSSTMGHQGGYLPLTLKLQLLAQAWENEQPLAHYEIKNYMPANVADDLLSEVFLKSSDPDVGVSLFSTIYSETLSRSQIKRLCSLDYHTFLRSCTIPKIERNCMQHSLENRLPFLDNEILRLSQQTPEHLMIDGYSLKHCLRELLKLKTNGEISGNPRKQGFTPPTARMLKNELREWTMDGLSMSNTIFSHSLIQRIEQWEKRGYHMDRLTWNIAILNHWLHKKKLLV